MRKSTILIFLIFILSAAFLHAEMIKERSYSFGMTMAPRDCQTKPTLYAITARTTGQPLFQTLLRMPPPWLKYQRALYPASIRTSWNILVNPVCEGFVNNA